MSWPACVTIVGVFLAMAIMIVGWPEGLIKIQIGGHANRIGDEYKGDSV